MEILSGPTITINPFSRNKLSAHVAYVMDEPVQYSYEVIGRSAAASFAFGAEEYATSVIVPVVGLYANAPTRVTITLANPDGVQIVETITIDATGQDFGTTMLSLDYDILDADMFNATLGDGWLVTSDSNGYDCNGDLRLTGLYPHLNNCVRTHDGGVYVAEGADSQNYGLNFYKVNLLGDIQVTYDLGGVYAYSHDVAWDADGNLFMLASHTPEEPTDEQKSSSTLLQFDDATGERLDVREYSSAFQGQYILDNAPANDVHFNSLNFLEKTDTLILNSRTCSVTFGVDRTSGRILWSIDNPASPVILSPTHNLAAVDPEWFPYPNGEHSVFLTTNPAYDAYDTPTRFALTVYNNHSCEDANGNDLEHIMETNPPAYASAQRNAQGYVYGIDLQEGTVEHLNTISFDGRSEYMGCIFETGSYYTGYVADTAWLFYIFDADNNIGMRAGPIANSGTYRARILSYDELRSVIL